VEALNPVPVPAFELSYNGRAITQDIAPYVMSATYTDHLTGEADSLDIELEDTDGRWLDRWYPEKGASLAYRFGYEDAPLISAGRFDVDELELGGPAFDGAHQGAGHWRAECGAHRKAAPTRRPPWRRSHSASPSGTR